MAVIKRKPLYFIVPLIVIVFLLPIFKMEYATDTYHFENYGFSVTVNHMLNDNGRPIIAGFLALFDVMGASVTAFYYFSLLVGIVATTVAIIRLYGILKGYMSLACALFFAIFTVLTPFTTDYFLFIEKGFFMVSVCMWVVALEGYLKILKGERIGWALSLVGIVVAFFTYQIIPGAFAVTATLFAVVHSKNLKKVLINLLVAIGIYGAGAISSVLFLKLFTDSNRVSAGLNIKYLFNAVFFAGYKTVFIYAGALLLLIVACAAINKAKGNRAFCKQTGVDFLKTAMVLLSGVAVMVVPFAFSEGSEVWLPFRISYPISVAIIGVAMYFCLRVEYAVNGQKDNFSKARAKRASTVVMAVILVLNLTFFYVMFFSRQINNSVDEELVLKIGEEISLYEKESGKEIKYIRIYHDESITVRNNGVIRLGDTNVRAFSKSWSDVSHINVILGKKYVKKGANKGIYEKYFEGKDWDSFSLEQLVFEGENLHICVY